MLDSFNIFMKWCISWIILRHCYYIVASSEMQYWHKINEIQKIALALIFIMRVWWCQNLLMFYPEALSFIVCASPPLPVQLVLVWNHPHILFSHLHSLPLSWGISNKGAMDSFCGHLLASQGALWGHPCAISFHREIKTDCVLTQPVLALQSQEHERRSGI